MYKLLTSIRDGDDLSICFDRNRDRRKRELTNNKNVKGKYHIRIYLKTYFDLLNIKKKLLADSVTN